MSTRPVAASLDRDAEVRAFPRGELRVVDLGDGTVVGRARFEPGWRWSEHVRPTAGTPSCEVHHVGYVVSGRLAIRTDDGTEAVVGPGEAFVLPPGHDGWVVGDEPCLMVDWGGAGDYARQ